MKPRCHHPMLFLAAVSLVLLVHSALPATAADADDTSTSLRASLLKYWKGLLPTAAIPAALLSRSSPLTAEQVATFSSYIDAHTLNAAAHLSSFCSAAKILCSDNLRHGGVSGGINLDGSNVGWRSHYGKDLHTTTNALGYSNYATGRDLPQSIDKSLLEPGLFFREADIASGSRIHIPDIRDKMPKTYFLPKELSDKLPFSSKSLPNLVELLQVSSLQSAMSNTMSACELQPMSGERKSCPRSIEDMASFVSATLGQKGDVLFSRSGEAWGQNATVVAAAALNRGKETATVVCHRMMFPYMVYYCHMVPGVKVYNVELLVGDGAVKRKIPQVALCHMDTSDWSANHAAFVMLGSGPGKIEACHFVFDSSIAWAVRG